MKPDWLEEIRLLSKNASTLQETINESFKYFYWALEEEKLVYSFSYIYDPLSYTFKKSRLSHY